MINRKLLRIKVIQYLYAYKISESVNYELTLEEIEKAFTPDIFAKVTPDYQLLSQQHQEASRKFEAWFEGKTMQELFGPDNQVNSTLEKALENYQNNNEKDERTLSDFLMKEGDHIFHEYLSILTLLPTLIWYEKKHFPKKYTRKKSLNEIFEENWLYQALIKDHEISNELNNKQITWINNQDVLLDLIKSIHKNETFINKDKDYTTGSFEEQKELMVVFYRDILLHNGVLNEFFEKNDLNWEINHAIVRSLVLNTFKKLESPEELKKQALSKNWEADKKFARDLFAYSIKYYNNYQKYIEEKLVNWDIKRVALIDKIILTLGITEMIHFKEIPVKVTINEYIELSKQLSEPNKKRFINGMLDNIHKHLKEKNIIKKSGRGLIDNK